jgi:hypothetical protein
MAGRKRSNSLFAPLLESLHETMAISERCLNSPRDRTKPPRPSWEVVMRREDHQVRA